MLPLIMNLLSTLAAAGAAVFSCFAVRALRRQTEAQIALGCLQAYSNVRRRRLEAVRENCVETCQDYYRELFDLHWSEYHLYKNRQLSASILRAWLDARYRNFKGDSISVCDANKKKHTVSYAETWRRLVDENYFAPGDEFVVFMNLVHDGRIDEALERKR